MSPSAALPGSVQPFFCGHCELLCRAGKLADANRAWRCVWRHAAATARPVPWPVPAGRNRFGYRAGSRFSRSVALPFASGIIGRGIINPVQPAQRGRTEDDFIDEDDEETAGGGFQFIGALTHLVLTTTANFKRLTGLGRRQSRDEDFGDMRAVRRSAETRNGAEAGRRREPGFGGPSADEAPFDMDDPMHDPMDDGADDAPLAGQEWHDAPPARSRKARVEQAAPSPKPGARAQREAQPSFLKDNGVFEMPSLHFLAEPAGTARSRSVEGCA